VFSATISSEMLIVVLIVNDLCFDLGSSEAIEDSSAESGVVLSASERQIQLQHRANATVHVCWHRNTSVSAKDMHVALHVCYLVTTVFHCYSVTVTSKGKMKCMHSFS